MEEDKQAEELIVTLMDLLAEALDVIEEYEGDRCTSYREGERIVLGLGTRIRNTLDGSLRLRI